MCVCVCGRECVWEVGVTVCHFAVSPEMSICIFHKTFSFFLVFFFIFFFIRFFLYFFFSSYVKIFSTTPLAAGP